MYVSPISTRLLRGMLTPEIRAKAVLPLTLLVPRVLADDEDAAMPADDLALLTHRLDRRSYLHGPFRCLIRTGRLWRPVRPPLPSPGRCDARRHLAAPNATSEYSAVAASRRVAAAGVIVRRDGPPA